MIGTIATTVAKQQLSGILKSHCITVAAAPLYNTCNILLVTTPSVHWALELSPRHSSPWATYTLGDHVNLPMNLSLGYTDRTSRLYSVHQFGKNSSLAVLFPLFSVLHVSSS